MTIKELEGYVEGRKDEYPPNNETTALYLIVDVLIEVCIRLEDIANKQYE